MELFRFPIVEQDLDGRDEQHWVADDGRLMIRLGRDLTREEVDRRVAEIVRAYRIRRLPLIPLFVPLPQGRAAAISGAATSLAATLAIAVLTIHVETAEPNDSSAEPHAAPTATAQPNHSVRPSHPPQRETGPLDQPPTSPAPSPLRSLLGHPIQDTLGKHPVRTVVGPHPVRRVVPSAPIRTLVSNRPQLPWPHLPQPPPLPGGLNAPHTTPPLG